MAKIPLPGLGGGLRSLAKNSDLAFVIAIFFAVILLVLPIPPLVLDLFLSVSIGISLLILLLVIYVKDPTEFSVFPTVLLAVTLFRLGLNVASTRLILLNGHHGTHAAGSVIEAFGEFVVRGNYVVGAVIFLILVIINFVVITKGSGRIAEVAARFTLDAMPGKQMSIDAELNAGIISEQEALARRAKIQEQADFYGAMDGASKFVRGDAVAGIFITLINVIGGILIGVFMQKMPIMECFQNYSLLSIGDGLVSQIPAIIVSVAAGLLVTRASSDSDLGSYLGRQLTSYRKPIIIAGCFLMFFGLVGGMPTGPFLTLGLVCVGVGYMMKLRGHGDHTKTTLKGQARALPGAVASEQAAHGSAHPAEGMAMPSASTSAQTAQQNIEKAIHVDTFSIEIGYGLLALADRKQGGDLIDRITGSRTNFAKEMGIVLPTITVRDSIDLDNNGYRFLLRNREVAKGTLQPNQFLAMNVMGSTVKLKGTPTIEPVYGIDAVWILESEKRQAEMNGYTVVDAPSVLVTHLADVLKEISHLILDREGTQRLIDMVKDKHSVLISELLPDLVSVGLIQRVLQNILKEQIPVKNLPLILETIADFAPFTKNPDDLSEQVRQRLSMYFMQDYVADPESEPDLIQCLSLDPNLENALVNRVKRTQHDIGLMMDPGLTEALLNDLTPKINNMIEAGLTPIVITTIELRLALRRFLEPSFPRLALLSYQEMPSRIQLRPFDTIAVPAELVSPYPRAEEKQLATA
jgi:flagellar biosynthesis protein FlhA